MHFVIREDDLSSKESQALLALHLAGMKVDSPEGAVYALDLSGLRQPNVLVFSAWSEHRIASIGALKILDDGTGEVKSMRTHPDFLGRGAASAILARIIASARAQGLSRLSLETGSGRAFESAVALYQRHGFIPGLPFLQYRQSEFNQFLHLDLEDPRA